MIYNTLANDNSGNTDGFSPRDFAFRCKIDFLEKRGRARHRNAYTRSQHDLIKMIIKRH